MSWDAVIGVIGTLLGTILGWGLARIGRTIINIKDVDINFFVFNPPQDYVKNDAVPDGVVVKFTVVAINRKGVPCSFNDCAVVLEYGDEKVKIDLDIFSSQLDNDELENLLNIDAFSTQKVKYDKSYTLLPHSEKLKNGYKIYMQYRMNGSFRLYKKIIHKE